MSQSRKRVLVVFIDAFGPEQLEQFAPNLPPHFSHQRSLGGVLGYSSGALPTILTGAEPDVHGRMCLFSAREAEQTSILRPLKWLGMLPRLVHERRRVRQVAEKVLARVAGLEGYVALHRVPPELFEWLDLPEREDLFQCRRIGDATTFLSDAREAGLSVYAARWQLPEAERWHAAHEALQTQKPDLSFLYATRLDGIMHEDGPSSGRAVDCLTEILTQIERARDILLSDGSDLTTLIVGDHGMAKVDRLVDPRRVVRRLGGIRLFVDSTMLRVWGNDSEISRVRLAIEKQRWSGTWMGGDLLRERKTPHGTFGNAMFVLEQGAIFAPSFLGGAVKGMHGYDVTTSSARAALVSDQPLPEHLTGLTSIAPIVRQQLGLAS